MECLICLNTGQQQRVTTECCNKSFCFSCLDKWYADHNTCPHCLKIITTFYCRVPDTVVGSIYICGSWDNWRDKYEVSMKEYNEKGFLYVQLNLSVGTYQYKYFDDNCYCSYPYWFCNPDEPQITTEDGYINNIITVIPNSDDD